MKVVRIEVTVTGEPGAVLAVRLALTWTRVTAVTAAGVPIRAVHLDDDSANLRFTVQAQTGKLPASFPLILQYEGEAPRFQAAATAVIEPQDPDYSPFWLDLETKLPVELGSIEKEYEARRSKVTLSSGEFANAARFFLDLDSATYWPLLAERAGRLGDQATARQAAALRKAADHLSHRTACRAAHCRSGLRFRDSYGDASLEAAIDSVERIMNPLLPRKADKLDVEAFDDYFRWFVTGKLALDGDPRTTHGQPNSENFFSFVEVVMMFRLFRLNWDLWRKTLPTLVTAAQVYTQLYWSGHGRRSSDYAIEYHRAGLNGAFTKERWTALRASLHPHVEETDFPPKLLRRIDQRHDDIFSDTVAHAFRDQTLASRVGGILVGGLDDSTMTLKAVYSTAEETPGMPTGTLLVFWKRFEKCVAHNATCDEPAEPEQWNGAIEEHVRTKIIPCAGDQDPYKFQAAGVGVARPSRSSPTGWQDEPGGMHFPILDTSTNQVACYFGCERVQ